MTSLFAGTNTKQIKRELNEYLDTKQISDIMVNVTNELLLNRPSNPVLTDECFLLSPFHL